MHQIEGLVQSFYQYFCKKFEENLELIKVVDIIKTSRLKILKKKLEFLKYKLDFYVESNEEGHGRVHDSFGEDELGCHTNFQIATNFNLLVNLDLFLFFSWIPCVLKVSILSRLCS
jgi:hypothetical protein